MNTLIIGGSSGLGLELAKQLSDKYKVYVTGRTNPNEQGLEFISFNIAYKTLPEDVDELLKQLPEIDFLIHAAGFFQDGTLSDLSDDDIFLMDAVGLLAPTFLLQRLLKKQNKLDHFIAVTSTSQWTPRLKEPVYTAVKAGLGMLANSVSLDERVGKVMVAGPAGMKTKFWLNTDKDTTTMLEPKWVAEQILDQYKEDFNYKYVRLLREPARVEIMEKR